MTALFGVGPGSERGALEALSRRAGVACRPSTPVVMGTPPRPSVPVVCGVMPGTPVAGAITYWYEDELLARAFLIDTSPSATAAAYRSRFDLLSRWITAAIGAPTQPLAMPPAWTGRATLSDGQQLEQLRAGHARLSVTWLRPDATIELWLAGENGRPVLAVGMSAAPRPQAVTCSASVVNEALLDLFPPALPEARARAAAQLAACDVLRAAGALRATLESDTSAEVQAAALRALDGLGAVPSEDELAELVRAGAPPVVATARAILARPATPARPAPPASAAPAAEPLVFGPPAPQAPALDAAPAPLAGPPLPGAPAPTEAPLAAIPPPAPVEPPKPAGPVSGTPLAIASSTIAGAAFMRNVALTGGNQLAGPTPQLLFGSVGAVIGFGTAWGLSRFGLRPTVEQAAWYTNVTAWGTLAGIGFASASGSDSPTVKYGLPAIGQAAGMGLGVWSSMKWRWSLEQLVVADSLVLGVGLMSAGVPLVRGTPPHLTLVHAFGAPAAMVAASVAARYLEPTSRDVGLMSASALAGGWTGALFAAGLGDADFLASRRSWGGAAIGIGAGYLGGVVGGAFSETSPGTLGVAGAGLLAGNVLGLGLHLTAQGFGRDSVPGATFTSGEVHARAFSAGLGGLLLGGAAYAYAPHLRPGPRATSMTLTGALYGAGAWWLASTLSYHGQALSDVDDARLAGGLLTGAALGGLTGLVSSRWFSPDGAEQAFAAGSAALGLSAGLGVAKLATDTKGTPDAAGVLLGAGVGLSAGALLAPRLELRAPDLGAGAVGLATGFTLGMLLPTIGQDAWRDSRDSAGGTLLGLSLGAGAGIATAHLTHASGAQVGVVAGAGAFGLLAGTGAGYMLPCEATAPCTSQPARVGAVIGTVGLMGAAMALEPHLHLSTLGPDAATLAGWGAAFGATDGLLLAATLDESGVISGTAARQAWGGILFGASVETAAGLVASKYVRLDTGDAAFLAGGKLTGGVFGLGLSMLARDRTGASDTLATLTGSLAGLAAAGVARAYTPLDRGDEGAAAIGASFGVLVGALAPTLNQPLWPGLDNRKPGGGALLGLSLGAIGGGALSHATDAEPRDLGRAFLGGVDGMATGLGLGLLIGDGTTSRSERIGVVAGTTAGLAVGALAWPRLQFGPGDAQLTAAMTGLGAWTGLWLPALGHADADTVSAQRRVGGLLAGAGLASFGTTLLTPVLEVDPDLMGNALALGAVFSAAGAGAGALSSTRDDAPVWGMLGGGLGGLVLGGALHRSIELDRSNAPFLSLAAAQGLWLGAWTPSLRDGTTPRERVGATTLGAFGALGVATVLSPVVRPSNDLVADAALLDGLFTGAGAGAGALFSDGDRAPVWGMLGAGAGGLVLGGALHDSISIDRTSAPFLAVAGGEGLWLGAWLPVALHGESSDRERAGALALGGFGGLGLATLASGVVHPDDDLVTNAAVVDAIWSGAGAGAGALLGDGDQAPVWGMLGAGLGGFALGGALHRSIEIDEKDAPLLTLATAQGLWLGAWLPYAIDDSDAVTSRQRAGALALGGFGGLGLATVASGAFELDPGRASYGGLGSALGATLGGGIALMSPALHDRAGVGLMLGGTGLGLGTGVLIGPRLADQSTSRVLGAGAAGAMLGVGESLLFAWSGRAGDASQYGGAALIGGGVGATLGIAAAVSPTGERSAAPAAAGFAAWGAWMGAFYGSLIKYDTHESVLGGLVGANAGFLAGYGLLQADLVQPRDFGWLSLFGALGTGLGAAAAAPFSGGDSMALRAGLAIGPGVGMLAGALVLPRLRKVLGPSPAPTAARTRGLPVQQDHDAPYEAELAYARGETAASSAPATAPSTLAHRLSQVGAVTDWAPMVGAMPAPAEQGPAPMLFGLTGHWR